MLVPSQVVKLDTSVNIYIKKWRLLEVLLIKKIKKTKR